MLQLPTDITEARTKNRVTIICLIVWVLVGAVCFAAKGEDSPHRAINAYIDHTHRLVRPSMAVKAKRFTPAIVTESTRKGLDPFLMAVIFFLESGLKPESIGTRGERGLSQVMPRYTKEKLDTPESQIRAGCDRMKLAFTTCGSLSGALTHYACGRCKSDSPRTRKKMQWRVKYYKRMKERFGK